jgi:hypothetical protein
MARIAARASRLPRSRAAQAFCIGSGSPRPLAASVAWEYAPESQRGAHRRPAALSDQAIAKIVSDTFARRPG